MSELQILLQENKILFKPPLTSVLSYFFQEKYLNRVFPILYWISLVSRIRLIKQEPVKHD